MELDAFKPPEPEDLNLAADFEVWELYPAGLLEQHTGRTFGKCRCFPTMELHTDDDGSIGLVIIDHHWTQ